MTPIRLALIAGGTSSERDVSLAGANAVFSALDPKRYQVTRYDPATDIARLVADAPDLDFAFLVLHGENGEDGRIQGLLDLLHLPYQGAGVLGSAMAANKRVAKERYAASGIPTPNSRIFSACSETLADQLVESLGLPLVVKPAEGGSSVGMSIVKKKEDVLSACRLALEYDTVALAESFIKGRELTCAVMGNRRLDALPAIEIIPGDGFEFFDYEAKYTPGATNEICPAPIPEEVAQAVQALAIRAHESLELSGYSRTDMILDASGNLHVLETNTIPGMTETSLLPLAAKTAGISFPKLVDRLIALRLEEGQFLTSPTG